MPPVAGRAPHRPSAVGGLSADGGARLYVVCACGLQGKTFTPGEGLEEAKSGKAAFTPEQLTKIAVRAVLRRDGNGLLCAQ